MNAKSGLMVLGDWGTSVSRFYLCRFYQQHLTVLARSQGRGIKHISDPEACFFELCQDWFNQYGPLPVFLIGTVGADIGWKKAPYVACPTDKHQLLENAITFQAKGIDITILPGVTCTNHYDLPDIMRGEETQLFGFLSQYPQQKEQLVCLPGTHTKWALLANNQIQSFVTSPVGELYEVLNQHSVLLNPAINQRACSVTFTQGLQVGMSENSNVLHTLFATRSLQVINNMDNSQAAGYLSGLLIGADVKAAMKDFHSFSDVSVIGSDYICSLYVQALNHIGITNKLFSSEDATILGMQALAATNWESYINE
ncbi:2-dehydro-3-deoxygalactonokinase [Flavobacterium sp. W21_SRS_FM6]|uniref:2-dehydro-3-deoxygalactonokinase n=1 Tax=Flavobacterium sp. W21_SRS_FM6 TaxID=3240268 RepID=UPI003F8FF929